MSDTVRFFRETLPLHRTASGAAYELDVWTYAHPQATQRVYLQGGLHGIELTGIPVLHEFMREIEERQLPLHCICVPQSNPMGLDSQIMGQQVGYNNLHTNQQNCWNWNRIGQLRDEPSQEGRWIRTLLDLSAAANVVLDLHTAGGENTPHVYAHLSQIEQAQGLGVPHVLAWEAHSTSFSDTCQARGQVALTFELSASRSVTQADIDRGLNALRRFFGILPKTEDSRIWQIRTQLKKWYAPEPGILCWRVAAGTEVRAGEPIATLYTRNGPEPLKSPYSGVLLLKNPTHAPPEPQELAKVLVV